MSQADNSQPLILLVFANDIAEPLPEIQQEMQSLQEMLQPVAEQLQYEIQILEYSTIDDFIACLDDNRDRLILLHFAGHSNSELLKLDEGVAHASGLAGKLRACEKLQLLFLNGCNNAGQVKRFVEVGIPATIGTYSPINDEIAREFSVAFYTELTTRKEPIATAFEQAKETISTKHGERHTSLDVRSFDLGGEASSLQKWAWFLEKQTEHDWKLEEAAHPCNRLPVLPTKASQDLPDELFKNLYYYQSNDAEIFFGRCKATLEVLDYLDKPDSPLLLLHGGTGVGKSSFLMAGLIPRLQARQQVVNEPFRYDEKVSTQNILHQIFNIDDIEAIRTQLDEPEGQPRIWILDQIEEIFFKPEDSEEIEIPDDIISKEEQQDNIPDVLNVLLKALRTLFPPNKQEDWPNARIILSLRTEWFGELLDACGSYGLASQYYMLKPLGKSDIVEIIEQPTKKPSLIDKYGLQIQNPENGILAEQIADDLLEDKESNIAPPLQIMLSKLWKSVENLPKQDRVWTQKRYEEKKKQGLLLSEHLDQQLLEIGELSNNKYSEWGKKSNESGLLLDVLHAHTTPQGTSKTLTSTEYDIRYAHIEYRNQLAKVFTNRYLLIDPLNNNQQRRLAHDTLAQVVKAKYETSDLSGQRARRILDTRKADWEIVDGKPKGEGLDRYDLKIVEQGEEGTKDWREDLLEVGIVKHSVKKRRNGRIILGVIISMLISAAVAITWLYQNALEQQGIAEEKTRIAKNQKKIAEEKTQVAKEQTQLSEERIRKLESNRLAVKSVEISQNASKYYHSWWVDGLNHDLSPPSFLKHLQLAKESVKHTLLKDNFVSRESFDALRKAVYATPPWYDFIDLGAAEPLVVEFSSDNQFLSVVTNQPDVRIIRLKDHSVIYQMNWNDLGITKPLALAFSPDNQYLSVVTNKLDVLIRQTQQ